MNHNKILNRKVYDIYTFKNCTSPVGHTGKYFKNFVDEKYFDIQRHHDFSWYQRGSSNYKFDQYWRSIVASDFSYSSCNYLRKIEDSFVLKVQ